jgi:hypothetical protein
MEEIPQVPSQILSNKNPTLGTNFRFVKDSFDSPKPWIAALGMQYSWVHYALFANQKLPQLNDTKRKERPPGYLCPIRCMYIKYEMHLLGVFLVDAETRNPFLTLSKQRNKEPQGASCHLFSKH